MSKLSKLYKIIDETKNSKIQFAEFLHLRYEKMLQETHLGLIKQFCGLE